MNYIKNIEIKNFKSIRHQTIDDCRRINVFIGYPNVGKSNILEALSVFSINEAHLDFSAFIRMENFTTLFFDGTINQFEYFDGEFSDQLEIKINEKHRVVVRYENNTLSFKQQFETEGTSFKKEDLRIIFLDDSADVTIVKSFQVDEKGKQISNFKRGGIQKQDALAEVKKYQFLKHKEFSGKGYSSLSYPLGDNIFNIISTNKFLKEEVSELFKPYNLELLYDTRLQEFTISKRTESGIFSIPYTLIADTIQRLIFYKAAILSNKEKVLLFEEPEAHMFPPYVKKFTSDVIFDETNQFFIATHSPYVLSEFIEEASDHLAVYVVDYDKGETIIKRLTESELLEVAQHGIDLFFNLESYLDKNVQQHSA
jgi:AAA15 family ATPase/GTPase